MMALHLLGVVFRRKWERPHLPTRQRPPQHPGVAAETGGEAAISVAAGDIRWRGRAVGGGVPAEGRNQNIAATNANDA
jgi:hypothetical protein